MDDAPRNICWHDCHCCGCGFKDMVSTLSIIKSTVYGTLSLSSRCFRTLGRFFTFEIAICPRHELITSGPYAWVRHPSYTGIYLTLLGATLSLCAPGTWLWECGNSSRTAVVLVSLWLLKCAFVFRGMNSRLKTEDEVLQGAFGESWDEYAKRVPYNFVPGVI
jgi:protein-S-isoprenylcysteine O-methyltransferase Ste14